VLVARPGGAPVETVAAERASVGYLETPEEQAWPTQRLALEPGSLVAVATDGFFDQVGGFRRIALGRRRVGELVGAHRAESAREIARRLRGALAAWQGDEPRRDDLTVLLFRARSA
jgi:serine phosphatase RsbU (regulator of sigma subunit)